MLALAGVDADPTTSREHVLVATLLQEAWRAGRTLDLASLIGQVQSPPVAKVGVLDVESFFPATDRFALAMRLNNVLAAPGFAAWLEGAPLDVGRLLFTPQGKPRVAVVSIAHLGDTERMFFVALLLEQVLAWVRAQRGTTSLRAVLYMDELFGFLPPTANPPTKVPLLTLLKQARAYGLGCVLATQNPVDLDYKALSNAGTWFLGRLQTERDKARVLDGLEGVASGAGEGFDRAALDRLLSSLDKRVFLLHNVHEREPLLFQTRWAMSYLRGPMGRDEIRALTDPVRAQLTGTGSTMAPAGDAGPGAAAAVRAAAAVDSIVEAIAGTRGGGDAAGRAARRAAVLRTRHRNVVGADAGRRCPRHLQRRQARRRRHQRHRDVDAARRWPGTRRLGARRARRLRGDGVDPRPGRRRRFRGAARPCRQAEELPGVDQGLRDLGRTDSRRRSAALGADQALVAPRRVGGRLPHPGAARPA